MNTYRIAARTRNGTLLSSLAPVHLELALDKTSKAKLRFYIQSLSFRPNHTPWCRVSPQWS